MIPGTWWWCPTPSCSTRRCWSTCAPSSESPKPLVQRPLLQRLPNDPVERFELLALDLRFLGQQIPDDMRGEIGVGARGHLGRKRSQVVGVVRPVRFGAELNGNPVELHDLRPFLDLGGSRLRRVRKLKTVEAAEDAVPLAQRARARLRDSRLAKVVAHLRQRISRRGDAPDDQRPVSYT